MDAEEAQERSISDMESLETEEPGMAKAVQDFFRLYKVSIIHEEIWWQFWSRCRLARERISLALLVRYRTNTLLKRCSVDNCLLVVVILSILRSYWEIICWVMVSLVQFQTYDDLLKLSTHLKVVDFLHLEWLDMMSNCTAIASSQDGQFGTFNTQNTQVSVVNLMLMILEEEDNDGIWKVHMISGGWVFLPNWTRKGREWGDLKITLIQKSHNCLKTWWMSSRFPCCVFLFLSWKKVNEQPPAKAGDADIPEKYQAWYFLEGANNHLSLNLKLVCWSFPIMQFSANSLQNQLLKPNANDEQSIFSRERRTANSPKPPLSCSAHSFTNALVQLYHTFTSIAKSTIFIIIASIQKHNVFIFLNIVQPQ